MNNDQIVHRIKDAKDDFGVITTDSAHNQLGSFSAYDWQQAAKIFSQDAANSGGLYIDDNNGTVTIHNDLSQAQAFGARSVGQHILDDAKSLGEFAAWDIPATTALFGGLTSAAAWSGGASLATGLAEGGTMAFYFGTIGAGLTAIGAPLAVAGDAVYNMHESSVARSDAKGNATVSV